MYIQFIFKKVLLKRYFKQLLIWVHSFFPEKVCLYKFICKILLFSLGIIHFSSCNLIAKFSGYWLFSFKTYYSISAAISREPFELQKWFSTLQNCHNVRNIFCFHVHFVFLVVWWQIAKFEAYYWSVCIFPYWASSIFHGQMAALWMESKCHDKP